MRKKFYIIGVLMVLSLSLSAGKIKKGFEALEIYNYFAAKKLFEKSLKKDRVAASYGLSIIYLRDDNPFYNLDSALSTILVATTNYGDLKPQKKEKYQALKIDSLRIFEQRDLVSDALYARAKKTHTVQAYQKFLEDNKWSRYCDSVIYFRDNLAYENAENVGGSKAYMNFITNHPDSYLREDAQVAYDRLIYQERTASNNFIDYVAFIKDFPESPYKADAEDQVYAIYTKTGSLESYKSFIAEYPENRNVPDAWERMFNTYLQNDYSTSSIQSFQREFADYPFQKELTRQLELVERELYPIKERNKWGYIDLTGNSYIPPTFDGAERFNEGMAIVSLDGKYGFINKVGELTIDAIFDDAYQMTEGHAVVEIEGKWGLINRTGEFVVQPEYDDIGNLTEGLAYFSEGELYGYFDKKGIVRLKQQYDEANDFENGKAIVSKKGYYGVIDAFGTTTIPFKYERLVDYGENSYKVRFDNKWGLISKSSDTLTAFIYDFIGDMNDNRAIVEKDGMFNYIDRTGKEILSEWLVVYPEYRQLAIYENHHAKIKYEDGYNIIDTTGKKLFSQNKDDLSDYGKFIALKKEDKWCYVTPQGSQVIGYNFTSAGPFMANGMALAGGAPLTGVINKQGTYIIEPYFEKITFFNDSLIIAKSRGHYGILKTTGDTLLNFSYLSIEPINDEIVQLQTTEALFYYHTNTQVFLRKERE